MKQMNMEFKDFESALEEEFSRTYMGTDDEMSDKFDYWLANLEIEDLIHLANKYGTFRSQR